jgi:membrane protein CcdC involved in cytochrome C biogenesis
MDPNMHFLTPILVALILGWSIFRRVRRSIGRQLVRPRRLLFRAVLLGSVGVLLLVVSVSKATLLGALLGGMVCGAALGIFGLQHTRFEWSTDGHYYTPHTYIGIFVVALLVARVAYRLLVVQLNGFNASTDPNPFDQYQRSPLTLGIFGLLVGYYVVYNVGVLRTSRAMAPLASAAVPASDVAPPADRV